MSNITQVVNADKLLKTLKKSVHASDLDQLLSSTGPYTFFAPSDLAFEKLEKGISSIDIEEDPSSPVPQPGDWNWWKWKNVTVTHCNL